MIACSRMTPVSLQETTPKGDSLTIATTPQLVTVTIKYFPTDTMMLVKRGNTSAYTYVGLYCSHACTVNDTGAVARGDIKKFTFNKGQKVLVRWVRFVCDTCGLKNYDEYGLGAQGIARKRVCDTLIAIDSLYREIK